MEKKIIFSRHYPHTEVEEMIKEAREYAESNTDFQVEHITTEELLRQINEKFTYHPRPGAEETSELFIALAESFSTQFEIDTEITREEHCITAKLFIPYSPFGGLMKRSFDRVCLFADELSFFPAESRTDGFNLLIQYNTDDLYLRGKKVDW